MVGWHHGHSALAVGTLGEAGRPRAPAAGPSGALWRLSGIAQSSAGVDHPHTPPARGGRGGDRHGITALELGAAAEARLCAGHRPLPLLSAGGAADHRRHHAGRGHPEDPPASETVCKPTSSLYRPVSARKPSPGPPPDRASGVTDPAPTADMGKDHAAVSAWACHLPAPGTWLGRHGRPASASPLRAPRRPVCHVPCLGRVLHARTRLNEALAMTARCPIVCQTSAAGLRVCESVVNRQLMLTSCVCISLNPPQPLLQQPVPDV